MGGSNEENSMHYFPINSRVRIGFDVGTVKYIGEVYGHTGLWVGVEWDDAGRGKHNGTVDGTKYFDTHPTAGSMIRPEKISCFESVREAIEKRYILCPDEPLDEKLMKETQKHTRASIFEAIGLEKLRDKQSHLEDLTTLSIANSNVNFADDLSSLTNLSFLDLSSSLIWNWKIVADILKQLPNLIYLDLSKNRLQQPKEYEIVELEPCFSHLKTINLGQCNLNNWEMILHTARLWPHIECLALKGNDLVELSIPNEQLVFKSLRLLDLQKNNITDFKEIVKLSNIRTLKCLYLMENKINHVELPECLPIERLNIFANLKEINIKDNPILYECAIFNELDKLPALTTLSHTINPNIGYESTYSNAVARISQLKMINKMSVNETQRRGAEYDIWKEYGLQWINSSENDRISFIQKCRAYPRLIKKYGSPEDLITLPLKVSNLITISIKSIPSTKTITKRVPRKMSVQTLQGIVIKLLGIDQTTQPILSYVDARHSDLKVSLDNLSKNLDYYSIQDGDVVIVEW